MLSLEILLADLTLSGKPDSGTISRMIPSSPPRKLYADGTYTDGTDRKRRRKSFRRKVVADEDDKSLGQYGEKNSACRVRIVVYLADEAEVHKRRERLRIQGNRDSACNHERVRL